MNRAPHRPLGPPKPKAARQAAAVARMLVSFGGHLYVRAAFSIFLSTLLVSGCSPKHTARIDQTLDLVAGKDVVFRDYVLRVNKRVGDSLEGIRIVHREVDGKETTITAATGTITQGPKQSIEAHPPDARGRDRLKVVVVSSPVKITLFDATMVTKSQTGATKATVREFVLSL